MKSNYSSFFFSHSSCTFKQRVTVSCLPSIHFLEVSLEFSSGAQRIHGGPDLGLLFQAKAHLSPNLTPRFRSGSCFENVLRAVCGRIGVPGGNVFPLSLRGGGKRRETPDGQEDRRWRTMATDFPAITGVYPPNVMPEKILADHPDRLRAVMVSSANPLNRPGFGGWSKPCRLRFRKWPGG